MRCAGQRAAISPARLESCAEYQHIGRVCRASGQARPAALEVLQLMARKPTKRRSAADQDKIIVEALRGVGRPVSAYELIEEVRGKGVSAPPTVYRALQRLIEDGLAHRLESLNAFVACEHPHHEGKAVFAICDGCGSVKEFDSPAAVKSLQGWASKNAFLVRSMTMELRGRCKQCAAVST